ncbi:MAG: hypothetical protein VX675_03800 [Planctomycetota bacterium]|nr:hypothetical protein [Planctomycetota bacterium]MEC8895426.1 hypothetical protein [Planctomycetota bacterium]MEC9352696.1 hypothetical protein [Planctomycetota bacterium]
MMTESMRSEDYQRRNDTLAGWPVKIASYRIGETHYCHIDNVSPGATIARAKAASLEEAEKEAIEKATERLKKTRRHD